MANSRTAPRLPAAQWPALRLAADIRRAKRRVPANILELDHKGRIVDATHQMAIRLGGRTERELSSGRVVSVPPARVLVGKNIRDLLTNEPHTRTFFDYALAEAAKPHPRSSPAIELEPTIVTHKTLDGGEADALVRTQIIPQGTNKPSSVSLHFHNLDDLISRGRLISDIFGIQADISKEGDMREALKKLANNLSRASGNRGDRAFVFVAYHDNGNGMELIPSDNVFQHGLNKEKFEKQNVVEVGKGLIGRAFEEERVVEEKNIRDLPREQRALSDIDDKLKITHSRAIPLIAEDAQGNRHVIGVISVNLSEKLPGAKTFQDYEKTLHDFFAQTAAMKLKDIRLLTHDDLTGLPNRRGLNLALAERIAEKTPDGKSFVVRKTPPEPFDVHYIDFNGFKTKVNDVYGHLAGDAVLKHIAREVFSKYKASRIGGDEFIAILPHESPEDAARTRENMIDDVRKALLTAPLLQAAYPKVVEAAEQGKLGVSVGTLSLTHKSVPLALNPFHKIVSIQEFHEKNAGEGFRAYLISLEKQAETLMYADKNALGANRERRER